MKNNYKGTYERQEINNTGSFNWKALIYWVVSLIVSLIPLYIELIRYLSIHQKIDLIFWNTCFVKGDILWVFSTLLLFVLVDSAIKKRKNEKKWVENLSLVGILVFIITEATWIGFYLSDVAQDAVWPLYIGLPLIIVSMIISTPLKIEFIKED